ncbi:sporulation phosphorelay system protein KapB [Paenibacillus sp. FSL H8-0537]|uniref:sporulation phosphorelay system protein KapB n=1 Tax=Paenibacillus sp. FSL H8-0537 TaxID=2921399 RepID=UPI003100F538
MEEARSTFEVGAIVRAEVRSGLYVGEVMELHGPRALFKVLAVLKHPQQGDLHHPYEPDVPLFHERPALAYTEKTMIPLRQLQTFSGDVPDYRESLRAALEAEVATLDRLKRWSKQGLALLEQLGKQYK